MTEKQKSYIRALLVERGWVNGRYGSFSAVAKALPHGPTMRERSSGFDAWSERVTCRQASEIITWLRGD